MIASLSKDTECSACFLSFTNSAYLLAQSGALHPLRHTVCAYKHLQEKSAMDVLKSLRTSPIVSVKRDQRIVCVVTKSHNQQGITIDFYGDELAQSHVDIEPMVDALSKLPILGISYHKSKNMGDYDYAALRILCEVRPVTLITTNPNPTLPVSGLKFGKAPVHD